MPAALVEGLNKEPENLQATPESPNQRVETKVILPILIQ
jgi:hypothetical protein